MTAGDQIVFIAAGVGRIDQISPRGTNQLPALLNDLATAAASLKASLACLRRRGPSLLSDHRTKNALSLSTTSMPQTEADTSLCSECLRRRQPSSA